MIRLKSLVRILLPVLFLFASSARGQTDAPFFFIQLADPQFGQYPFQKDFQKERRNFTAAIKAINRLKPEFVVVCGDLTNRAGNVRQVAAFRETLEQMDRSIPVFLVAGNHDVGNKPTTESLRQYRKEFGDDYYTFKRHGRRFIVLNSSLIKSPGRALKEAQAQRDWLNAVLDSTVAEHAHPIVFQHHPWFISNAREPDGYFNVPGKTRKEYLRLLESHGVEYVFAGHLHANAGGKYGALNMVTSGPVGMPLGTSPSGIRIVVVRPTGVTHKYYPFKKIPVTVNIKGD